jgi:hypothetical protein
VTRARNDTALAHQAWALTERIVAFARREALVEPFSRFPADRPPLAAVAHRRAQGTRHPAVHHPELVDDVAA